MSDYVPRHLARASPAPRRPFTTAVLLRAFVAALVLGGFVAGVVLLEQSPPPQRAVAADTDAPDVAVPAVERPALPAGAPVIVVPPPSPPTRVEIPAIGVSSALEALAFGGDGSLEAPGDFQSAGWFAAGTQPGQRGPAVIAGHVDSRDGPAVFFRLGELAVGDEVLVAREDGSQVRFRVTDVRTYPKDAFPTSSVYGPVPGPELRLVTCDGPFDRSRGQYVDNLVVYAVAL